jgi:hypothetical protein
MNSRIEKQFEQLQEQLYDIKGQIKKRETMKNKSFDVTNRTAYPSMNSINSDMIQYNQGYIVN